MSAAHRSMRTIQLPCAPKARRVPLLCSSARTRYVHRIEHCWDSSGTPRFTPTRLRCSPDRENGFAHRIESELPVQRWCTPVLRPQPRRRPSRSLLGRAQLPLLGPGRPARSTIASKITIRGGRFKSEHHYAGQIPRIEGVDRVERARGGRGGVRFNLKPAAQSSRSCRSCRRFPLVPRDSGRVPLRCERCADTLRPSVSSIAGTAVAHSAGGPALCGSQLRERPGWGQPGSDERTARLRSGLVGGTAPLRSRL